MNTHDHRKSSPVRSSLLLYFTSFPGWTFSSLSEHFPPNQSWRFPARGITAEAECAPVIMMLSIHNSLTSKSWHQSIASKAKKAESGWKGSCLCFGHWRCLQIPPGCSSFCQSWWMCLVSGWDQLCLCACLVGAERPQSGCYGARSPPALIYLILLQWGGL